MTQKYLMFSVAVPLSSVEEWTWLRQILAVERRGDELIPRFLADYREVDDREEQGFDVGMPDELQPDGKPGTAMFYHQRSGDPDKLAHLLGAFLRRFHPDRAIVVSWAETCAEARPNQCSGGVMVASSDQVYELDVSEWVRATLADNGLQAFESE